MNSPFEPKASYQHRCATCNKAYSTNSHLRRHEATHSGRQELTCPVCHAQFSRRDLARRHVQNCSTSGHEVILPILKRGRKRTSCDRCSRHKLSCDAKDPCMRCRSGGVGCTYGRLSLSTSQAIAHLENGGSSTHGNADSSDIRNGNRRAGISVEFLLNFTDPSGYRPSAAIAADAINLNSIEDSTGIQGPPFYLRNPPTSHDQSFSNTDETAFMNLFFPAPAPSDEFAKAEPRPRRYPISESEGTFALEIRAREIVSQLGARQSRMQESDGGAQANFDAPLADAVFTVANIQHFIWGYFHYFHDQFPILHQASFDVQTASLPLLLTVVLFGSMSYNPSDASITIQQFFDVAEAYVFDQVRWVCTLDDDIEKLQAGLLFLMLQNNCNDLSVRRRVRLQRIPQLVGALRAAGVFAYRRKHYITNNDNIRWQNFVYDEVRLRMAVWTFMTDSTLAVFFNSAPHVSISEMTGDLPCAAELFEAETAPEFERLEQMTPLGTRKAPILSDLVPYLLSPRASSPLAQAVDYLTAADMLMLVCALQSALMTSRMNYFASATADTILHALDRWKEMWDVMNKTGSDGIKLHKGFERHANEYWWLARMIIKIEQSGDQRCRYMQPAPSDSAADLHEFVQMYKDYVG
ncbi:hypothetical protein BKA63DRAFT_451013 [Paraphoma chrysanthemicola]|nr:hypothetical protein BKA63DRAFT_451013 [Paraphoma chrysanthemicola]